MNRFAAGLVAGGFIGTVGLTYMLSDKRNRKRMMRDGKKLMKKGKLMADDFSELF